MNLCFNVKKNSKVVIFLYVLFFLNINLFAQKYSVSIFEKKANSQTIWMQSNLDLSENQYDKIYNLNLLYAKIEDSIEHVKNNNFKSDAKQRIKKNKYNDYKIILNSEQYKQFILHIENKDSNKKSPFTSTY